MSYKGFGTVQLKAPQKSLFDRSRNHRTSTRMGRLTPILIEECIPGDYYRGSTDVMVRLAPMPAPIYDQIFVYVHFFFVPNRLLWEDWEEFITGGRLGVGVDPVTAPIPPNVDISDFLGLDPPDDVLSGTSTLADYLGLPPFNEFVGSYAGCLIDVMPFAAYYLCWYEYYRDRNFVADNDYLPLVSGTAVPSTEMVDIMKIKTRDYLKDYFTSALPFTQRGEEVLMPLEGTGSVTYLPQSITRLSGGTAPSNDSDLKSLGDPGGLNFYDGANSPGRIENIDEVLLTASSVSINDFRAAYSLQVWLERNAVAGSRYTESIQAHFAVRPQDSRLQRPEYLGGGRVQVQISEVVTTAFSNDGEDTVPAANLLGHGITFGNTNQFQYFCPEHGFIIGILSIMNPPSYQQGVSKMWRRRSFLDYPWPTFAKLGEQQVDKAELYASPTNLTEGEDGTLPLFGYQSRYAEWKAAMNSNSGQFRDTLLFWTLTRTFDSSPVLSEEFVSFDDATQNRIFIVNQDQDNFWLWIHNNLTAVRALPYFGTPNTLNFS